MEVQIRNGRICGTAEGGMLAFKNIPFAQPPVGRLRFQPPQPAAPWDGVRDCTAYGPRPCQNPPPWSMDRHTAQYSEDCLNLNVWTPAADGGRRPVLFNIYGGGHMEGSNSELEREGWRLAHGRDVVVVAPNYRVGPLGYLYLPHLLGGAYAASGSLGLLDQIAALRWVRENIAALGGDPNRVTILGQSAGGKSVCSLLAAPGAQGLFQRAVAMSGALQCITDTETDRALTRNFLAAMGLKENDAARLLTCPVEDLLAAQEVASETYFKAESYGPTADGVVLPTDVAGNIRTGGTTPVPVLIGHTREELCLAPDADTSGLDDTEAARRMVWKFGDNAPLVLERYHAARQTMDAATAYGAVATEYTYVQGAMRTTELLLGAGYPLWLYRWDFRGGWLAHHSSDNEALFGTSNPQKVAREPEATARLEQEFQQVVLNFAEGAVPQADGLPSWPACTRTHWQRMIFDDESRVEDMPAACYNRDFPLQAMKLNY